MWEGCTSAQAFNLVDVRPQLQSNWGFGGITIRTDIKGACYGRANMGTPACGRWSHTYLHCYTHLMLVFNTSDYRTIGLPCVDRQTKVKWGPWMQLAIERNTSLLVDCPSHFLHATHQIPPIPTSIHREVWRLCTCSSWAKDAVNIEEHDFATILRKESHCNDKFGSLKCWQVSLSW